MEILRIRNLSAEIIDIFDDFLVERGIEVPSSIECMKENQTSPEETGAALYGVDYFDMMDDVANLIRGFLKQYNIEANNEYEYREEN